MDQMLRNIPMEGLPSVRWGGTSLWGGCDWSDGAKYSYGGAVTGQMGRNIPMEGL
jgi:hypothetical protein